MKITKVHYAVWLTNLTKPNISDEKKVPFSRVEHFLEAINLGSL